MHVDGSETGFVLPPGRFISVLFCFTALYWLIDGCRFKHLTAAKEKGKRRKYGEIIYAKAVIPDIMVHNVILARP